MASESPTIRVNSAAHSSETQRWCTTRNVRFYLTLAFCPLLGLVALQYSRLTSNRQSGVFAADPPTPYFHYLPRIPNHGRVLMVHGLNGNKEMMNPLGFALADAGFDVYSIDLPGHGASRVPFSSIRAKEAVVHVLDQLGPDTSVLGHSLGGGLLLDIANDRPFHKMVLFSPAPTPVNDLHADRVLLYVGQLEIPRIRAFAGELADVAGSNIEFHDLAWTGHTGAVGRPEIIAEAARWLGGDTRLLHTNQRLFLLGVMLVSSIGLGISLPGKAAPVPAAAEGLRRIPEIIVHYVAAFAASAVVVWFIPVAGWLHVFATDYVIGLVFVSGLLLCAFHAQRQVKRPTVLVALAAAAYVIVIPGLFVGSEFTHLMLTADRSWRFALIAILGLPLFIADEILLRPIRPQWKAALSLLLTRAILGSTVITAALLWNREAVFLLMIMHLLVAFWIVLWVAGGFLYRRTTHPFTVAFFMSLVQAWVFAALFVIT